jgi:hypothetical protein
MSCAIYAGDPRHIPNKANTDRYHYIELGLKDTADSLKYMIRLTDNLSRKYVADSRYYDQISAQEITRFAPIARRDNPYGAHAELEQCIKFVGEVKKMN